MVLRHLIGALFLTLFLCFSVLADDREEAEQGEQTELAERVGELEREVRELKEQRDRWSDWTVLISGEFRGRAIVEANTRNNYLNKAGVLMHAYRGDSTIKNDYGWWDYRGQLKLDVGWTDRTSLHLFLQLGNAAWGNQAPIFGGSAEQSLGNTELVFRELYVEVGMDPIPLRMRFGRQDAELGNRLALGVESDGLDVYYQDDLVTIGFMGFRRYEGERYEFSMKHNDDTDEYALYAEGKFDRRHSLLLFGFLTLYEVPVPKSQSGPDPLHPLYNIPWWNPLDYGQQGSELYIFGANWISDWSKAKLNLEFDFQTGQIKAASQRPWVKNIQFKGLAAFAKLDLRVNPTDILALSAGYGSGDDPETIAYEGFFAPNNDFGIEEDSVREYIERGFFAVYEHLSPPAGVPGRLFEDQSVGGLENTIYALLGYDLNFQANHHYYLGVGSIWAAEPNPETGSRTIGIEVDCSIDYRFGEHVWFRFYGGHLFMLGDYFRANAYDAAAMNFEWKVVW